MEYWNEDYAKQTAGHNKEYIEKKLKEFNDRIRSGGRVTLREIYQSMGIKYNDTFYATVEEIKNSSWQFGGSVPELHLEKNDASPYIDIEFDKEIYNG